MTRSGAEFTAADFAFGFGFLVSLTCQEPIGKGNSSIFKGKLAEHGKSVKPVMIQLLANLKSARSSPN